MFICKQNLNLHENKHLHFNGSNCYNSERGHKDSLSVVMTAVFISTATSRNSSTVGTLLTCVAANPTLMAFHPLKTCWPTSC